MGSAETVPRDEGLIPADWPTAAEQRYADAQRRLADEYGVEMTSRVTDVAGVGNVHYLQAGTADGEPVVLLHGLAATGAMWIPMLDSLTDEYNVIIPDRPGRGLSVAPSFEFDQFRPDLTEYLDGLLDNLGIEQPHVVGNSLGGLQAFLLALDHDRAERLCLVGAPGGLSREFPRSFRLVTVPGLVRLLLYIQNRGDPMENSKESLSDYVMDTSAVPEVFHEMSVAATQLPGRTESYISFVTAAGRRLQMHPAYDISDEVVTIDRPTSFIWGTEDWFFDPDAGRPIAEQMSSAEFHALEGYGHVPWLEPGDEVGRLVREFL